VICYHLRCSAGHEFEAWFRSSAAFEEQRAAAQVSCAVCGGAEVEKSPMAPSVRAGRAAAEPTRPASPAEALLASMRRHIERTADYVGAEFAAEARRIHAGEAKRRSIWGETSRSEARALADEGIPVTPIPWMRRSDG
jgi:hypothetical protein